jgi:hypothetical protein
MQECLEIAEEYRATRGFYPSEYELSDPIRLHDEPSHLYEGISEETRQRWWDDGTFATAYAEQVIFQGALQVIASQMLGQRPQLSVGNSELHRGIRQWNAAKTQGREYGRPKPATKQTRAKPKKRKTPAVRSF